MNTILMPFMGLSRLKFLFLILISMSLVSCGKDGNSSSNTKDAKQEEIERNYIDAASVGEAELLNVTINEMVTITQDSITFSRPVSVQNRGQKISCSFSISSGETWNMRNTSNGLEIEYQNGSRKILKPVGSNIGIMGSWIWSGKENGSKMIRRYSLLPNRLIINQDCEG